MIAISFCQVGFWTNLKKKFSKLVFFLRKRQNLKNDAFCRVFLKFPVVHWYKNTISGSKNMFSIEYYFI